MKHPFAGANHAEILAATASIIQRLAKNPSLLERMLSGLPTLSKLQDGHRRLHQVFYESIGDKAQSAALESERKAFDRLFERLTGLAYLMSDDVPELLELFGLKKQGKRKSSPPLTPPRNPRLRHGTEHGVMIAKVTAVKSARCYEAQICVGDPNLEANWMPYVASSHVTIELRGLVPGTLYWFRFRGIGPGGTGPWSEPVCLMAI